MRRKNLNIFLTVRSRGGCISQPGGLAHDLPKPPGPVGNPPGSGLAGVSGGQPPPCPSPGRFPEAWRVLSIPDPWIGRPNHFRGSLRLSRDTSSPETSHPTPYP